nr:reverse transcriptase domain-containing protein [Tanacetum cinerariifolium]
MSSPNHLTSNIDDAFSEYIVPDYSPVSPGKTYSSASNNATDVIPPTSSNFSLFHNDPYINVMNAYATFTPSPIPIPPLTIKSPSKSLEFFLLKELLSPKKQKQDQYFQDYEMGESSHDSTLEQHGKQIEEILNHLDELPLDRIERIEDDIEGLGKGRVIIQQDYDQIRVEFQKSLSQVFKLQKKLFEQRNKIAFLITESQILNIMPPKRSSTSEASTMSQAAIRKLVAASIAAALEIQTATMAEADNFIREIPVAKRGNYKEFISFQPFYFNGTEGVVGLIRWFERTESVFSRSKCAEANKVAFAIGTLTNDALSWWNAYAQPIRIEQANRITWTELKRLLTNKYCPQTKIKKMEDEFYNLSVKGNDLTTYVRIFQELAVLCPNMRCTLHHTGPCTIRCRVCNKVGHLTKNYRNKGPATGSNLQPISVICHACGEKGHYRSQCSKTNINANERTYLLRDKNAHQDPNVVTDKKRLENIHIVREFPDVFPEELPGLPPVHQAEFQIDLIPGASPVARAPYRLAPSEMQKLSNQLQELSH